MADLEVSISKEHLAKLADDLASRIPTIRNRRNTLTDKWILNYSAWRGNHTRSFFKSDTFGHFIPAARRVVERFVTRGAQMLIPSSEFFEVYPTDEMNDELGKKAEATKAYLLYIFRKKIKVYSFTKQLLRCLKLYARAIVKTGIKLEDSSAGSSIWPTARVVDPFMFFVWPEIVTDMDNAQMLIEDNVMPWETYRAAMEAGQAETILRAQLTAPEWPNHITRKLSEQGIPNPGEGASDPNTASRIPSDADDNPKKPKPVENFLFISEVWMRRGTSWWFVWLLWNIEGGPRIVKVGKKFFNRSSYRMAVGRELPGEHYTTDMMDDVEPVQVLLNDQVNLTLEGQAVNFAPPTVVDPDMVSRASSLVFRPRALWLANPAGVKFLQPHDTTKTGYLGIQFTMGLMDTFSGSSPLAEGQPTRNLPRAGFAVSSLLSLSLADIKDSAILIEDNILTPILGDLYRITIDLVPESQVIKIPATAAMTSGRRLKTKDMEEDFEFAWVGSIQSQDLQVRSQRLIALLDVFGRFAEPIQRDLEISGKKIRWDVIAKRLWREGLGERGADTIIGEITTEERKVMLDNKLAELAILRAQQRAQRGQGVASAAGGGIDDETASALEDLAKQTEQQALDLGGDEG